ncbi:MAG: insulinase family protein [Pseudomonadales bacterium]|nr:insulinase family protein [Pseudomonadales bacterium]
MSVTQANTHSAFELLRTQKIASLNTEVQEYRHKKTGAMHYHMAADNPENVFLVGLRTVPLDSTGVAHILEHTALCGSKRFPVRDPFFMMIRRSLNTFMNAFTSSDWTAYPFASQNRKDYFNLLDVYLDAVFFSNLDELDFRQEGHRLEFAEPENPESELVYKGVVFNEMKGAMSSVTSILWQTFTQQLYPSSTYHFNSGGDPEAIPDLSYDELKAFYKTHYHPSNATLMTYGDIPVAELHSYFDEKALSHFERSDKRIEVKDEKRLFAPIKVENSYAVEAIDESKGETLDKKTHIVLGWMLGESTDLEDLFQARLLSSLLLDNSASPLLNALETTDLGTAPSPLCGVEDSNRELVFMCGVEGSEVASSDDVEALILGVLEDVEKNGVPQSQLDAVLHQLEIQQREIGGDGYPFGLQLILRCLGGAVHYGDPIELLDLEPVLEKLREQIKQPDFVQKLVRKQLLDNPHRVRLTLKPDTGLADRRNADEVRRLAKIKSRLTAQQTADIIQQTKDLNERQNSKDDESILPKVGLEDVPAEIKVPSAVPAIHQDAKIPFTYYGQGTNGLVYQQVILELPALEPELLQLLPYYTSFVTELGFGELSYRDAQARQSEVSGGVSAFSTIRGAIDDPENISGHLIFSGKALEHNHVGFSELMKQIMDTPRFDELSYIRELMAQTCAHREQSITGSGHSLAMTAAASGMGRLPALNHRSGGLQGIQFLKALNKTLDDKTALQAFADSLKQIHQKVIAANRQYLLIGEPDKQSKLEQQLIDGWPATVETSQPGIALPEENRQVKEAWICNSQVNFCAKAYKTVPSTHPDAAALMVLGNFLRNGFLHRAIREQGGAYGGGAGQDSASGVFRFFSYRDPRLTETMDDFDQSIQWLATENHEDSKVEEAILGVIGGMDKPGSPAGEAKQAFHAELAGRTPAHRNQIRDRVLKVTIEDLKAVGAKYLKPEAASVAVVSYAAMADELENLGFELKHL